MKSKVVLLSLIFINVVLWIADCTESLGRVPHGEN